MSIYSVEPAVHDAVTKIPGSLTRSLAAIERLIALGVRVKINCPLMQSNVGGYRAVRALAEKLGVPCGFDPMISARNDGDTGPMLLRIGRADLKRVLGRYHAEPRAAAGDLARGPIGPRRALCGAGHNACYVSAYGDVTPCVALPVVCGNIRETPFAEIWNDSRDMRRVRSIRVRDLHTVLRLHGLRVLHALPGPGAGRGRRSLRAVVGRVRARPGRGRARRLFRGAGLDEARASHRLTSRRSDVSPARVIHVCPCVTWLRRVSRRARPPPARRRRRRSDLGWDALLALAEAEDVLPAVAYAAGTARWTTVPARGRRHLADGLAASRARHLVMTRELARALRRCAADGIDVIALKGPVLAETVYPDPALRPFSDLDLLVRPADRRRTDATLRASATRRWPTRTPGTSTSPTTAPPCTRRRAACGSICTGRC